MTKNFWKYRQKNIIPLTVWPEVRSTSVLLWLLLLVAWELSLHYTALHSSARDRDPEWDRTARFSYQLHYMHSHRCHTSPDWTHSWQSVSLQLQFLLDLFYESISYEVLHVHTTLDTLYLVCLQHRSSRRPIILSYPIMSVTDHSKEDAASR